MSVDRLIRSVSATFDTLSPPDLADLCPRVAEVGPDGAAPHLGLTVDPADRPLLGPHEHLVLRGSALVRIHAAVDPDDGCPLRRMDGPRARVLAVAAGVGPLAVTDHRVVGVLRADAGRPRLAYVLAWSEVDDVGPAPSGGVRLLATALLGALTLDLLAGIASS